MMASIEQPREDMNQLISGRRYELSILEDGRNLSVLYIGQEGENHRFGHRFMDDDRKWIAELVWVLDTEIIKVEKSKVEANSSWARGSNYEERLGEDEMERYRKLDRQIRGVGE